jgi:hypothetical protein
MHPHAGFRESSRDEDMQAGGGVSSPAQPPVYQDDDEGDHNTCREDEEFSMGYQLLTTWKRQ